MNKLIVSFLVIVLLLFAGSITIFGADGETTGKSEVPTTFVLKDPVYELELKRWGISNNGVNPTETTNGINAAINWAKQNGYKTIKIPGGTYLIAKGKSSSDREARINMVSDLDFILSDNTILKKETNGFEGYSILHLGKNVRNVTVRGGTYIGDRDTHDYTKKGNGTAGTHEWGNGIEIVGAENIVIDGVKIERFTGDGIIVSGATITGSKITKNHLEKGGIDEKGNEIETVGKIRTNSRIATNFDDPAYEVYRNIHFWLLEGIESGSKVDVFYYHKDGSFISSDKQIRFYSGESIIPKGADYFRAVFNSNSIDGIKVNRMTVDISRNVTIQNSDIGYNRRQGISLVGSDGVEIINNHIHHTGGTAPQSGIDIEPGYYPGRNTVIKDNKFTDNKIQIVLAYGENVKIDGNTFIQTNKGTVGVHAHQGFRGEVQINNNNFNGSDLTIYSENAKAINNTFMNGEVKLLGKNIEFSKSKLIDASLSVGEESGQRVSEVNIKHNGKLPGVLYVWKKEVLLEDVKIEAKTKGKGLIFGPGNDSNVYNRIKVKDLDRKGTGLPAGIYNNSYFEAGWLGINREGKYVINNSTIKNEVNLLRVDSTYGYPEVTISNSTLEIEDRIGYGAAIYILGAKNFILLNNKILAKNNMENKPLIKIGPSGQEKATRVFGATIKENKIYTKNSIYGVDTQNAGYNSPVYTIENNTITNAKLKLAKKDKNINNNLIIR